MRFLAALLWVVLVVAVLSIPAGYAVHGSFAARAKPMQLAQVDEAAQKLFGDATPTKIGSPQLMIVDDPKAFLPGEGDGGAKLLNDAYLKSAGIYPIQMKTIDFMVSTARLAALGAVIVAVFGLVLVRRKRSAQVR